MIALLWAISAELSTAVACFSTALAIWRGEAWPPWVAVFVLCSAGFSGLVRALVKSLGER